MAGATSRPGALRSLLAELQGWARFLLPSRYVATYYPTPAPVVAEMLDLAQVGPQDCVYDLGCGDGRIVIAASRQRGARGVGVELCPDLAARATAAVAAAGVGSRVRIMVGDAAAVDVGEATVLALYLSEQGNRALLRAVQPSLRPGTRVVSLAFPVAGWEGALLEKRAVAAGRMALYLYRVPNSAGPGSGAAHLAHGGGGGQAAGLGASASSIHMPAG